MATETKLIQWYRKKAAVKSTCCISRVADFNSQHPCLAAPGDPTLSSMNQGHLNTHGIDSHSRHIHINSKALATHESVFQQI